MSAPSFTSDGYRTLVRDFLHRDYTIVGFEDVVPEQRHLVLRHDLDMSLAAGVEIAERETELGVATDYFILMRSELYNPGSGHGRKALRQLMALGHRVGLHFDPALYEDDDAVLETGCAEECAALEELLGVPVRMVSFHRPRPRLRGLTRQFAGRPHAYEPRFFRDIGYCSNSRGEWGQGHPLDHPAVHAGRALQLLTHPIWWTGSARTPQARLHEFISERSQVLEAEVERNCSAYRPRDASAA